VWKASWTSSSHVSKFRSLRYLLVCYNLWFSLVTPISCTRCLPTLTLIISSFCWFIFIPCEVILRCWSGHLAVWVLGDWTEQEQLWSSSLKWFRLSYLFHSRVRHLFCVCTSNFCRSLKVTWHQRSHVYISRLCTGQSVIPSNRDVREPCATDALTWKW